MKNLNQYTMEESNKNPNIGFEFFIEAVEWEGVTTIISKEF